MRPSYTACFTMFFVICKRQTWNKIIGKEILIDMGELQNFCFKSRTCQWKEWNATSSNGWQRKCWELQGMLRSQLALEDLIMVESVVLEVGRNKLFCTFILASKKKMGQPGKQCLCAYSPGMYRQRYTICRVVHIHHSLSSVAGVEDACSMERRRTGSQQCSISL